MDNFGQFLYLLRKEKGMTQAELAEALGVTNKAVSKWETDEAMPETSLLLPLSRIFDVTVDELLDGKRHIDNTSKQDSDNNLIESEDISDRETKGHLFTPGEDEDDEKTLLDKVKDLVCTSIIFLGVIVYLLLGILQGSWHPYWIIIVVGGMLCAITGLIFDICNKEKISKKRSRGENPYTGAICGFVMLASIIVYLVLGVLLNLWHPLWIIPACGGISCGIIGAVGEIMSFKKKK